MRVCWILLLVVAMVLGRVGYGHAAPDPVPCTLNHAGTPATAKAPSFTVEIEQVYPPAASGGGSQSYGEVDGCLRYEPSDRNAFPYYTGVAEVSFFDDEGHFLGASGQQLAGPANTPLPVIIGSLGGHRFGAGVGWFYPVDTAQVGNQILVTVQLAECATQAMASCSQQRQFSSLMAFDVAMPPLHPVSVASPSCGAGNAHPGQSPVFHDLILDVFDSPDRSFTNLEIRGCVRLAGHPSSDNLLDGQVSVVFFNSVGAVLATGGQQLGLFQGRDLDVPVNGVVAPNQLTVLAHGTDGKPTEAMRAFGIQVQLPSLYPHDQVAKKVAMSLFTEPCSRDPTTLEKTCTGGDLTMHEVPVCFVTQGASLKGCHAVAALHRPH